MSTDTRRSRAASAGRRAIDSHPPAQSALRQVVDIVENAQKDFDNSTRGEADLEKFAEKIAPPLLTLAKELNSLLEGAARSDIDPGRVYEEAVSEVCSARLNEYTVFDYLTRETQAVLNQATGIASDADDVFILELFAYCCAIHCLRKASTGSTSASSYIADPEQAGKFVGVPIAYFYKAQAVLDSGGIAPGGAELRFGYELALAALERFKDQPGALNLVASFEVQIARSATRAEYKDQVLDRAFGHVNRAIHLDPEYPTYWALRAEIFMDRLNYDRSVADLNVAIILAAARGDERLAVYQAALRNTQMLLGVMSEVSAATVATTEARELASAVRDRMALIDKTFDSATTQLSDMKERVDALAVQTQKTIDENRRQTQETLDGNRRDQLQLIAVVSGFIGLIMAGVTVVGQRTGDISQGAQVGWWFWLVLIAVPALLLLGFVVVVRSVSRVQRTGTATTTEPDE